VVIVPEVVIVPPDIRPAVAILVTVPALTVCQLNTPAPLFVKTVEAAP
jgi:hypothetical protein